MGKYVVKRKDVCAGKLQLTDNLCFAVYDELGYELTREELQKQGFDFELTGTIDCRAMLFRLNEEKMSQDLIYDTKTPYPVEGVSKESDSKYSIEQYVELDELLKLMNYKEELTQEDLNDIYNKLIAHRFWLRRHKNLFGDKLPIEMYEKLREINKNVRGRVSKNEENHQFIKRIN